ncbi:MAG TPA: MerR family transcriptional regulator [Candidatus Limnocylindrales bacterium]|nr:MerR family transcriptional regulator [Candidatus Limnocylindrales bacterium]
MRLSIGDFSRMTHLSVKALRHYHEVGLLAPAEVDPSSGYRWYEPGQVRLAHVIRRLRDLGMPLEQIREVLAAPGVEARNRLLAAHTERMEAELAAAQAIVAGLRSLLDGPAPAVEVTHRRVGPQLALAITERVRVEELDAWWEAAFGELDAVLSKADTMAAGPRAALYSADFFELGEGEVMALRPVAAPAGADDRVRVAEIPAAELAIAVHHGGFGDIDLTYGLLGTHVGEREIGMPGPIREVYVVSPFDTADEAGLVTEVCWPVFQTRAR